jgi:hypothetical protein
LDLQYLERILDADGEEAYEAERMACDPYIDSFLEIKAQLDAVISPKPDISGRSSVESSGVGEKKLTFKLPKI